MDNSDLGRVASPNRPSSTTEPASGLGPTGFDPARIYVSDERRLFCANCGRTTLRHRPLAGVGFVCVPEIGE